MFKNLPPERRSESGFSLIELLVVCVVLIVVLGIMTTIISGVQSNYNSRRERAAQMGDATAAMDLIKRVIRNAGNNTAQTALTPTGNNRLLVKGDWNPSDGALDDGYENVEFFVSNNKLYMIDNATSPAVVSPITEGISSIYFQYLDASGNTTASMSQVARVKVTLIIGGANPRTLSSDIAIRNRIQPR